MKTTWQRLQDWYEAQCNGTWEHRFGISIESCDNPGWWVRIELTGTGLEGKSFSPVEKNVTLLQMERIAKGLEADRCDSGSDWMLCHVKDNVFDGSGDPQKLEAILEVFLGWAEKG